MSTIFVYLMIIILVGAIARALNSPILSPSSIILFALFFIFTLAALIHPKEFKCVVPGLLYFITLPSAFVLLNIYAVINLNNVSWGTRETKGPNSSAEKPSIMGLVKKLIMKYTVNNVGDQDAELVVKTSGKENVQPESDEIKNWTEHFSLKNSEFDLMSDEEKIFFDQLINKYLFPNVIVNKEEIKSDLDNLRNKCSFYFLLVNSLWYLLLFSMQLLKDKLIDKIYIRINFFETSLRYEPIYFSFVMVFVLMLVLQFVAMILHRAITFIQVIRKTSLKNEKKQKMIDRYVGEFDNPTFGNCGISGKYTSNLETVDTVLNL